MAEEPDAKRARTSSSSTDKKDDWDCEQDRFEAHLVRCAANASVGLLPPVWKRAKQQAQSLASLEDNVTEARNAWHTLTAKKNDAELEIKENARLLVSAMEGCDDALAQLREFAVLVEQCFRVKVKNHEARCVWSDATHKLKDAREEETVLDRE
jgi:hypothetical protein